MRFLLCILGFIFGSLGSVILTRFADGVTRDKLRGFFFGYSECPHCHHRLKARNLIPVISYLIQEGKCAYCKKEISRIYPVLELLCAGVFVISYFLLKDFGTLTLIFGLLTNRLLILLLVYDLKEYELHMIVWILLAIVGILANVFAPGGNLRNSFLATLLFGGIFTGIYFFGRRYAKMRFGAKEGFGEGDIYLAVTIGMLMPFVLLFHNIPFSQITIINVLILFILLSSIIGLIRAGLQYICGRWKVEGRKISEFGILNSELKTIPFFPAMIIAFWILAWKLPYFITLIFG